MTIDTDRDFGQLKGMAVPVKRAAFSDRTAWIMAILSELAYTPFDEESNHQILELAKELAELTDQDEIAERLIGLQKTLRASIPQPVTTILKIRHSRRPWPSAASNWPAAACCTM
jgi:hypothetical protein